MYSSETAVLCVDADSLASAHPVRKFVIDFLRRIVIDSLSVAPPNKSTPVIDVILEVSCVCRWIVDIDSLATWDVHVCAVVKCCAMPHYKRSLFQCFLWWPIVCLYWSLGINRITYWSQGVASGPINVSFPYLPLDNIRVMVIVWRSRGNIIRTAPCWVVWHNVHSQQHTHMSSSYRSSTLGLSHWDPYAMHRGGCLELYYCNMVEWCWWESSLIQKTN